MRTLEDSFHPREWPTSLLRPHGSGAGCIADEFQRAGVTFEPAHKGDRVQGWQRMRRMLADAGKPDRPGLYISRPAATSG